MTQQYIKGELSLCLEFCDEPGCFVGPALSELRRRVEDAPLTELPELAREAVGLVEEVCWASLEAGDMAAFERGCDNGAQLHEFAVCAGLLP
jgi:hypothetical protein